MSERAITNGIQVDVESYFVPEHSDKESGSYFFSYKVRIQNSSTRPVQLLSRHWVITDGRGHVEEVKGPGVIGQQPELQPGQSFEYESFCPLPTPTGIMRGTYQMVFLQTGETSEFDVEIPRFFLVEPGSFH
jgi:ApaG protein